MIKNIVFDMGGVLIDLDLNRTLAEHFPPEYHQLILDKVFNSSDWRDMDAGRKRAEDFIPAILPQLPEETRPLLKEMISNFYPYMPPLRQMETVIERLKKSGYKVYLLSNATPRFFDVYQNYPALCMLDGYFISALYKLLKPQKEIYEAFCNKFGVKAEECFFIDDLPANIEGARKCGMQGFVFDTKDLAELENQLNALGVKF
ncbi:MAG: HAD family phosphatase [Clostridia bacterium]|nr:HAD family phosphatase [Clostridia bacterium]